MIEQITIKVLENPDNPKLKMKYVGSIEYATPRTAPDGKIRTGFDENAYDVMQIADDKQRKKVQAEIIKNRTELEKLLRISLETTSSFWDKFFIPLGDEDMQLDPNNAMDRVKEIFLVANYYVAPSKDHIREDERYLNCIFYIHRESVETSKKVQRQKDKDKATSKLYDLFENNQNKLKTVASYIFAIGVSELSAESAYEKLSDFLEESNDEVRKKNIKLFLSTIDKTQEELTIKLVLDKALKKRLVQKKGNIYRRGDVILGNSYEEAISNLSSVELNGELTSLIKEVGNV